MRAQNRFWRMMRRVLRDSPIARGTPRKSPPMSVTGAAETATSAPVPVARPAAARGPAVDRRDDRRLRPLPDLFDNLVQTIQIHASARKELRRSHEHMPAV